MTEWWAVAIAVLALAASVVGFSRARTATRRADIAARSADSARASASDALRVAVDAQHRAAEAVKSSLDAGRHLAALEQRMLETAPPRLSWRIDQTRDGRFRLVNTGRFTAVQVTVASTVAADAPFVKIYAYPDLRPDAHMDFDVLPRQANPLSAVRVTWSDVSREGTQTALVELPTSQGSDTRA